MVNRYDKDQLVRCSAIFTTVVGGAYVDPAAIFFKSRTAAGVVTTYEYGVDVELVKDAVGQYHADVDADAAGRWSYRFYGTGAGQSAAEDGFDIIASQFP